ncbi:Exosome complex component MTR3 [Nymphon striatum]|nr:Exosome complex component MTR3 [Nymphon striatum]
MLDQIFGLGTSNIKLHTNTNKIRLEKGVRQGDSISPKLFTACLENVFRGLNWTSKGIPINGDRLTNLRFADDVVLFSESPQELQLMVEELRTASSKVGLEINLNRYFQNSIKMPVDTKRICGPDQSSPYYLYSQLSQSSTDKKNVVDQKRDQEKDLYKLKPMFLTGGLSFGNDDGGAVMYFFVIRTGVVSQAKGSAYIEIGNIKIIASVYGPREVLKKRDFNINGQLNCEVKYAPYSCPNIRRSPQGTSDESELSTIVCDALKPAVCMQKFPKSRVDVFVIILETGDSGEVITCASLAIADAGIEMYDVVIGSTLKGGSYFAKKNENKESKSQDHGSVTVGLLPSLDQVSCFIHKGEISSDNLSKLKTVRSFSGSGHRKGEVDSAARYLKTEARRTVVRNIELTIHNARELYEFAWSYLGNTPCTKNAALHARIFFYVDQDDVKTDRTQTIFRTIKGTQKLHSVTSTGVESQIANLLLPGVHHRKVRKL